MNSRLARLARGDAGSSATEFALILPLLTVMLFGLFEVGRMLWSYNIVSSGARDAARYGARLFITCSSGGTAATQSADQLSVQRLARTGTVDGSGNPLIPGWTSDANVTVTADCVSNSGGAYQGRYDGLTQIPRLRVTATAPFSRMFGGLIPLPLTQIRVTHSEVWTQ